MSVQRPRAVEDVSRTRPISPGRAVSVGRLACYLARLRAPEHMERQAIGMVCWWRGRHEVTEQVEISGFRTEPDIPKFEGYFPV